MKTCQLSQARYFDAHNQVQIANVSSLVLAASHRFMKVAKDVLPSPLLGLAHEELSHRCVPGFIRVVRPQGGRFIAAGMSSLFWNMVDAANFLADATDATWPYMSLQQRSQNLVWSAEYAALVGVG